MTAIAQYLTPISEEKPAGEDLAWDPALIAIRSGARQKITQRIEDGRQVSSFVEPDYRKLLAACEAALGRSRDLEVALYHCIALTEVNGFEGAAAGLELIAGMVQQFWPSIYPLPDEGDNLFDQRVGLLENLSQEQKPANEDPFRFVTRLKRAKMIGQLTLAAYEKSKTAGLAPEDADEFQSFLREAMANETGLKAFQSHVNRMEEAITKIEGFFADQNGPLPKFRALKDSLAALMNLGRRIAPDAAVEVAPESATAVVASNAVEQGGVSVRVGNSGSGMLASHQDVIRMLNEICAFYVKNEPASPVPLLLQRAKRLVGKSFIEIISDIADTGLAQVNNLAGVPVTEA